MALLKWISGASLAFVAVATAAAASTPAFPKHATGNWEGTLQTKDGPRRLFVNIYWRFSGDYAATLFSPEQKIGTVVVRPLGASGGTLAFTANGGQFQGEWSEANSRWEGTWTEEGSTAPLILSLNDDPAVLQLEQILAGSINIQATTGTPAIPPDIVPPSAR